MANGIAKSLCLFGLLLASTSGFTLRKESSQQLIVTLNTAASAPSNTYYLSGFWVDGEWEDSANQYLQVCSVNGDGSDNTKVIVYDTATQKSCTTEFSYTSSYSGEGGAYDQLSSQVQGCSFPYQASWKSDGSTVYLTLTYGGAKGVVDDNTSGVVRDVQSC